jgi:catalase
MAKVLTTLYPAGRPLQILQDGYRWGKAVATIGSGDVFGAAGIEMGSPGVYQRGNGSDIDSIVKDIGEGLHVFRFLDRYPLDVRTE